MKIAAHNVVSLNYTLRDAKGHVLDSSEAGEPLVYLHGVGGLITGLEEALTGKVSGEKLQVIIPPEKAYGQYSDKMLQKVPRSEFPSQPPLTVGLQFQVQTDNGPMVFTIKEVGEDEVTLDGNHPLAGVTLHFDVEVVAVRQASAEEVAHGHVHGHGGHHH